MRPLARGLLARMSGMPSLSRGRQQPGWAAFDLQLFGHGSLFVADHENLMAERIDAQPNPVSDRQL